MEEGGPWRPESTEIGGFYTFLKSEAEKLAANEGHARTHAMKRCNVILREYVSARVDLQKLYFKHQIEKKFGHSPYPQAFRYSVPFLKVPVGWNTRFDPNKDHGWEDWDSKENESVQRKPQRVKRLHKKSRNPEREDSRKKQPVLISWRAPDSNPERSVDSQKISEGTPYQRLEVLQSRALGDVSNEQNYKSSAGQQRPAGNTPTTGSDRGDEAWQHEAKKVYHVVRTPNGQPHENAGSSSKEPQQTEPLSSIYNVQQMEHTRIHTSAPEPKVGNRISPHMEPEAGTRMYNAAQQMEPRFNGGISWITEPGDQAQARPTEPGEGSSYSPVRPAEPEEGTQFLVWAQRPQLGDHRRPNDHPDGNTIEQPLTKQNVGESRYISGTHHGPSGLRQNVSYADMYTPGESSTGTGPCAGRQAGTSSFPQGPEAADISGSEYGSPKDETTVHGGGFNATNSGGPPRNPGKLPMHEEAMTEGVERDFVESVSEPISEPGSSSYLEVEPITSIYPYKSPTGYYRKPDYPYRLPEAKRGDNVYIISDSRQGRRMSGHYEVGHLRGNQNRTPEPERSRVTEAEKRKKPKIIRHKCNPWDAIPEVRPIKRKPYTNTIPETQKYNYYKYYGFAGQGAKTSWAHNLPLGLYPPYAKWGPPELEVLEEANTV